VEPDPRNHREHSGLTPESIATLGEQIREFGQLTPIWVGPWPVGRVPEGEGEGVFRVIAGHRRLYALRHIEAASVRAMVFVGLSRGEVADLQASENNDRVNPEPCEQAMGFRRSIDARLEDRPHLRWEDAFREVVKTSGKSSQFMRERLDLLKLPKDAQALVDRQPGGVSLAQARELIRLIDANEGNAAEVMRLARKCDADRRFTADDLKHRVNACLEEQAQCSLFGVDEGRDPAAVREQRTRAAALTAAFERIAANTFDRRGQRVSVDALRGDELRTFRAELEGAQRHLRDVLAATLEALGEVPDITPVAPQEPITQDAPPVRTQPIQQVPASVLGLQAARANSTRSERLGGVVTRVCGPDRWLWVHGVPQESALGHALGRAGAVWTKNRGGAWYAPGGERAERARAVLAEWAGANTEAAIEAAG